MPSLFAVPLLPQTLALHDRLSSFLFSSQTSYWTFLWIFSSLKGVHDSYFWRSKGSRRDLKNSMTGRLRGLAQAWLFLEGAATCLHFCCFTGQLTISLCAGYTEMIWLQAGKLFDEYLGQRLLHHTVAPPHPKHTHCRGALKQVQGEMSLEITIPGPFLSHGGISTVYWGSLSLIQLFPLDISPSCCSQNTLNQLFTLPTMLPLSMAEYELPNTGKPSIPWSCHSVKLHSCFNLLPVLYFTF